VKSAAGVFIQPVHDAGSAGLPQWARIAHALRDAAASGAVQRGERLPSARQLAQDWQVSRGAVEEAFAELQLEGLIERRVGDGTYLSGAIATPPTPARPQRQAAPEAQRILQRCLLTGQPRAQLESARRQHYVPPLHPRRSDLDHFPLDIWRRLMLQAHESAQRTLLDGAPCGGLPVLREAITRHLAIHRGLNVSPSQVLVTNGAGESMQLVGRLLLAPGDTMWMENPSHATLPWLMESMGIHVQGLPLDAAGLDVAAGLRLAPQARLCYLHPLTQYPLGVRTGSERCAQLLAWAADCSAWIVEGHMNDEMVPPAQQPPTLFARDTAGRTLMVGTFEGVAFPSLRVGYLVLPPVLAAAFIDAAQVYGEHVAAPVQWALAQFIDHGHMTTHLQAQRQRCTAQRALVRRHLLAALPAGVRAGPLDSGQHLCLHLPPEVKDTAVAERLRQQRLFVEPLSLLAWQDASLNGIVLGYGGLAPALLQKALSDVARTLAAACGAAYQPVGQNT
jgi:GntR family transcriptional regulator/MocR family aminotransferase